MSKYICLNCKHYYKSYCKKHTIEVSEEDYCVDWEEMNNCLYCSYMSVENNETGYCSVIGSSIKIGETNCSAFYEEDWD